MRKLKFLFAILLTTVLLANPAHAAIDANSKSDPNPQAKKLCETISLVTGVAISPLLGVGGVGCYQWCTTPKEKHSELPWFANPLFWLPAMLLVGVCFLKDAAGPVVLPSALKKPLDVAEAVENKVSGLVATGAFVPLVATIFKSMPNNSGASLADLGFASFDLNWLYNALMIPVAMAAFFIVFLASNAINILILISPFSTVDAALKSFRAAILASVVGTSFMNPWIGAAWAIIVILISYLIAGWSFRLSHFGVVFIWDFFTGRKHRFQPDAKENKMFLARKINKVPSRTYGKLSRNEKGELVLNYRPWLILPQRSLVLPPGTYETGRGIFYSEIVRVDGGDSTTSVILLPPRYLGHEEQVAKIYNLAGTRDVGLRAAWAWFKSLFTGAPATT